MKLTVKMEWQHLC